MAANVSVADVTDTLGQRSTDLLAEPRAAIHHPGKIPPHGDRGQIPPTTDQVASQSTSVGLTPHRAVRPRAAKRRPGALAAVRTTLTAYRCNGHVEVPVFGPEKSPLRCGCCANSRGASLLMVGAAHPVRLAGGEDQRNA